MLNLFIGEIVLRTPGNHQLPGYANIYLGKWGKSIMMASLLFGVYGALIAYIIGEGRALSAIFGGSPMLFSLIFFAIVSILVFIGLKAITKSELIFASSVLVLILVMGLFAILKGDFNIGNLAEFNLMKLAIPYGVVLFSFVGGVAVPEMKECLIYQKHKLKKAVIIGSLIPLAAYIIFAAITIGITGANTTEISTIGLGQALGKEMIIFGNLFAALAMFTSSLTLALAMKGIYHFDFKIQKTIAWVLTMTIPLLIFLSGAKSFINVIGMTGAFAGGIDGILIVLIFWKARKKKLRVPEYNLGRNTLIGALLILIFTLGILYQLFNLF